jgi:hypothetical protein
MSRFPKSVSSRHFTTAVGVFMVAILAVGPAPKLGAQQSSQLVTLQALGTTPRLRDFVPSQHAQPNGPSPLMPLRVPPEATKSHGGGGGGGGGTSWTDPVLQSSTSGTPNYTVGGSFDGVPESGYVPSDSNLAVGICNEVNCAGTNSTGQKQIVEVTNVKYAIYTASGVDLLGSPQAMHTIWAPAGSSSMCSTVDGGDPIALFDRIDQRWIISQLAYNSNLNNDHICLAISTSSDATGSYNLYDLQFGANFPDYPKLAVWSDGGSYAGIYLSANIFLQTSS